MSEDPLDALQQVLDRIDEGCNYGSNWCTGGWFHNASKEEIINFIYGSLRARVMNALERTKEAQDATARVVEDFRQYISNTNVSPEIAETIGCYLARIDSAIRKGEFNE